jgi:hypothetical protein
LILTADVRSAFLILLALAGLAAPAALASGVTKGDGTLSVKDGNGKVTLTGRVSILGRVESGRIFFTNLDPTDVAEPDVFDTCDRVKLLNDATTLCIGTKLRFRLLGARYKVTAIGRGIDISAVGKGQAILEGADATFDDGDFAVNGAPYKPITDDPVSVLFGTATPPPPPAGP